LIVRREGRTRIVERTYKEVGVPVLVLAEAPILSADVDVA
jgi:hypothetical protein